VLPAQVISHRTADARIVLDDQDSHRSLPASTRPSAALPRLLSRRPYSLR
jgi:hypothetical protein